MHRRRTKSGREGERGVVILLVAIVLLFVVGAMAVLAIDLVTFYTARSEAQLAADGAALAAARVMANSGATSDADNVVLQANAQSLATTVATQVAAQNRVGGRNLNPATEITVTFPPSPGGGVNPKVTVHVSRNDLPTFFARIWGRTQVSVSATATAEAYNPSGLTSSVTSGPPIAPVCLKPWVLPNINPILGNPHIFDATTGQIMIPSLLGRLLDTFQDQCSPSCGGAPAAWHFYPGNQSSFPAPTLAQPACSSGFSAYQLSITGCVQTPIACNGTVNLVLTSGSLNAETVDAVNCLTHSANNKGDRVDTAIVPSPPFQFLAGDDNPIVNARGKDILVSDSLVTVPVFDSAGWTPDSGPNVQVIGFVQLFLNPGGEAAEPGSGIKTTVINMAGCGANAVGQPIIGNGASAIPVRLISP